MCHAFARHEDASWNLLNDLSKKRGPDGADNRTIGPRLCQGGSSLQLRKPPGQEWLLWAFAFAPGLALSTPWRSE